MATKRRVHDGVNYVAVTQAMAELLTWDEHAAIIKRSQAIIEEKYVPGKAGRPIKYVVGTRVGTRVITGEAGHDRHGKRMVHVQCDCGHTYTQDASRLARAFRCTECVVTGRGHHAPPVEMIPPRCVDCAALAYETKRGGGQ